MEPCQIRCVGSYSDSRVVTRPETLNLWLDTDVRNSRTHPTEAQLRRMSNDEIAAYAKKEAAYLTEQKQTAVPRLLSELAIRVANRAEPGADRC
jgi:hypothetical protein